MEHLLPVVHSTFSPEALVAALWPDYSLPEPISCRLIKVSFNDHYLVSTRNGDYVLRLYHHGWRSEAEVAYELAALAHLEARGVPVCGPIARRDGAFQHTVPAPEGPRAVVLFPFAKGNAPNASSPEENRTCGRVMALIHRHSDDFACEHQRFSLDLDHLIDKPIRICSPFLVDRPDDIAFLQMVALELHRLLDSHVRTLDWGYCHGDYPGNSRIDANRKLRVFDFDCGGLGWRAYDLAVCMLGFGAEDAQWKVFCEGYEQVRSIPEAAKEAIPRFLVARQLWRMGLFAEVGSKIAGNFHVNDDFFDFNPGVLRERVSKYLPSFHRDSLE